MSHSLDKVRRALKANDRATARKLLKTILQTEPSADAWTLAALVTDDRDQQIKCVRKALQLDEWHTDANRMLSRLESVSSASERGYHVDTGFQDELAESQRHAQQQGRFFQNFGKGLGDLLKRKRDEGDQSSK